MILLHAAPITWGPLSGLNASVPGLVAAQNSLANVDAALVATLGLPAGWAELKPNDRGPLGAVFPVFGPDALCSDGDKLALPPPFDRPDLVVFHSTYIPAHVRIARRLRRLGIPYVICPRGGMTRYAQNCKWFKKRIGNLAFFNRLVAGAAALQCLTPGEAAASQGWNRPVFIAGNGVDLPDDAEIPPTPAVNSLRFVFMGRLHIDHKGLDMLVDACALVRGELLRAGAAVELCGPDCQGSVEILTARIARRKLGDVVRLVPPVRGAAKTALLAAADVFVHPSRTEGHPIAVLEALAHGVPCLLTPNTNMAEEVAAAGAGWAVEPSPEGIAAGLGKVLSLGEHELRAAGLRARQLAAGEYTWQSVARRSVGLYRRYAA